jgi:hypothetical protein
LDEEEGFEPTWYFLWLRTKKMPRQEKPFTTVAPAQDSTPLPVAKVAVMAGRYQ